MEGTPSLVGMMEEQAIDDAKNPGQQESAYGSLESSSQGQSQKSSYSGSKSLNSGSSHSSGFCGNADYSENQMPVPPVTELQHKDHNRKTREKIEKLLLHQKLEKVKEEEKEDKETPVKEGNGPRLTPDEPIQIDQTDVPEENLPEFTPCHKKELDEPKFEQPSLVYTQALHYIRKIKERSVEQVLPLTTPDVQRISKYSQEIAAVLKSLKSARGFTAAISVQDGTVLHVSPSITEVLGFPKDMLTGQSFIDFVYPRDSINLSSKIIHGMNPTFGAETIKDSSGTSFFCRLRMYHGLRSSGFGVRNKRTLFKPCKMTLKHHDTSTGETSISIMTRAKNLLLANVIPIDSAYTSPEETPSMGSFSTRHTGGCNFSEYDPEAIPYLGHLPQDLIGHSVFDYYHPVDLPLLKSVYQEIVNNQGKLFKSAPYRFRAFNGSYVTLETEWLCFVNPWSKKIESIIGQHRVLKGPSDVAIFTDPSDKAMSPLPEEIMKDAKKAQSEITDLLNKPVAMYMDPSKEPQQVRRKTLANKMSSIVEQLDSLEKNENKTTIERRNILPVARLSALPPNKAQPLDARPSVVKKGQESVNSSCEAPSSYGQLNYSETMHRFFRSQPKTVSSDESGDSKMEVSHVDSSIDCKSSSQHMFSVSGGSGNHKQSQSCSGDNYCENTRQSDSTGNGSGSGDTGRTSSLGCSYRHVQLTEEVLYRHNTDMQKMFIQRQRTDVKTTKDKWKIRPMKKTSKRPKESTHGVKRPAAAEQEATSHKHAFIAPSASESCAPLKLRSAEVWSQADNSASVPPYGANGASVEVNDDIGGASRLAAPSFPGIMPGFYLPTSSANLSLPSMGMPFLPSMGMPPLPSMGMPPLPSMGMPPLPSMGMSPLPSMDSTTVPQPPGTTLVMQHQQPAFLQPQASLAVPLQYMGAFPGVMYQPVGPSLFNAPPLMLPNMVYQHTVVQPPLGQVTITQSDGEKPSGAESEHEMDSGKRFGMKRSVHLHRPDSQATSVKAEPGSARCSNASASAKVTHAADSLHSYIEEHPQMSPGCALKDIQVHRDTLLMSQISQSTSVQAEAESIRSPGKQEKMVIGDQETRLDIASEMVMSVSSSTYSSREYKSTDDSLQNISENSENSEASQCDARWKLPRSKCPRPVLHGPQWLEDVKVTPKLLYKYQLESKELVDVLRRDMDMLKRTKQDLALRKKKTSSYFSRMAMLHEAAAPVPSPDLWSRRMVHHVDSSNSSS